MGVSVLLGPCALVTEEETVRSCFRIQLPCSPSTPSPGGPHTPVDCLHGGLPGALVSWLQLQRCLPTRNGFPAPLWPPDPTRTQPSVSMAGGASGAPSHRAGHSPAQAHLTFWHQRKTQLAPNATGCCGGTLVSVGLVTNHSTAQAHLGQNTHSGCQGGGHRAAQEAVAFLSPSEVKGLPPGGPHGAGSRLGHRTDGPPALGTLPPLGRVQPSCRPAQGAPCTPGPLTPAPPRPHAWGCAFPPRGVRPWGSGAAALPGFLSSPFRHATVPSAPSKARGDTALGQLPRRLPQPPAAGAHRTDGRRRAERRTALPGARASQERTASRQMFPLQSPVTSRCETQ